MLITRRQLTRPDLSRTGALAPLLQPGQRLDDVAEPLRAAPKHRPPRRARRGPEQLLRLWAARHAHVHNDGLVDDKYLSKVSGSAHQIGQRVIFAEADARLAIHQASALVDVVR